jgi:hypothetical protein
MSDELDDYLRHLGAERAARVEALPTKHRRGVAALWIALEQALQTREGALVEAVAKAGLKLEVSYGIASSTAGSRRLLLEAVRAAQVTAPLLEGLDPRFGKLSAAKLKAIVAAYAPGKAGRGGQGVHLTAARLSTACGAFDDKHEGDAQLAFKEAGRATGRARRTPKRS